MKVVVHLLVSDDWQGKTIREVLVLVFIKDLHRCSEEINKVGVVSDVSPRGFT